jgi:hypothetical protein
MSQSNGPGSAVEVLDPAEQAMVQSVIQQASVMAGLTAWERHKIEWRVRRQRGELILQLAGLEAQTVFAEAVVATQGRIGRAKERAAFQVFKKRLECLVEAGHFRDATLSATTQLTEDSRDIIGGAVDRVTASYITGLERRAEGLA